MSAVSIAAFNYGTPYGGKPIVFAADRVPDSCPICHNGIEPIWKYAWIEGDHAYAVYQCPKKSCYRLFISYFDFAGDHKYQIYFFKGSSPWEPIQGAFHEEVKALSPSFCSIYDEAYEAEQRGLIQICGSGYRKALEFLIKDYLIKKAMADKNSIRAEELGRCIDKHIDDPRIKQCSKRAAWLGNDETHYDRRWEDNDLQDLKTLIELTCNWIQSVCLTEKFMTTMPKGK